MKIFRNTTLGILACLVAASAAHCGGFAMDPARGDGLNDALVHAVAYNDLEGAWELIDHGANVRMVNRRGGDSLLHIAASTMCCREMAELLIARGVEIDARNRDKETALHVAADHGNASIAEVLIRRGANINAGNNGNHTPLYWAAREGHDDVAALLLAAGARTNGKSKTSSRGDWTPLHHACQNKHEAMVARLLTAGADANATTNLRKTPLHVAAYTKHVGIVRRLLAAGANPNITCYDSGNTPLHVAAERGRDGVVACLCVGGADLDSLGLGGRSALHFAAICGWPETVCQLVRHGADMELPREQCPFLPTDPFRTPLQAALGDNLSVAQRGDVVAGIRMLLELGVQMSEPIDSDMWR